MSLQRLPIKKGRPYILLLLLFGVILAMILLAKCSHRVEKAAGMQRERVKSGGDTLDVAIEISPLSYRFSGDSVVGLDYEIMKEIGRMSHRPVKFHAFAPLKYAEEGLDSGLYDIVISSLPSTEMLKQRFVLTEPVYLDREVLVQRKDAEKFIKAPEELGNDTVWIAAGSPFVQRIENLSSEIGEPIHVVMAEGKTAEHLIMLTARGEIDRAVVNEGLARRMTEEYYPELDMKTPVSFTQFQCWIVSDRDKSFPDSLNAWIGRFRETGRYGEILKKYGL